MQNGALLVFGLYEKNVDSVFSGTINIFGLRYSLERFMLIVFAYLIIAGLMVFLNTSKRGQAMRAVAQDYDAARLLGINVDSFGVETAGDGCAKPRALAEPWSALTMHAA